MKPLKYMNFFIKCFIGTLLLANVYLSSSWGWNALGHRLVAQIAVDQLPKYKVKQLNQLNHELDVVYPPISLVNSAIWPDLLKGYEVTWFDPYHYINLPFSDDHTKLPEVSGANAVDAVYKSLKIINSNRATGYDKGVSLRILMHVTGDLHQPLHAATRVSKKYPQGDKGGNLYYLRANSISNVLHGYWDKGGGFLSPAYPVNKSKLKQMARQLEAKWPCSKAKLNLNPSAWADESHKIAVNIAYSIPEHTSPDRIYQQKVKNISQQRIVLAGCRLGELLQRIQLSRLN